MIREGSGGVERQQTGLLSWRLTQMLFSRKNDELEWSLETALEVRSPLGGVLQGVGEIEEGGKAERAMMKGGSTKP